MYLCKVCNREFPTKQKLGGHARIHSPNNFSKCDKCQRNVSNNNFEVHVKSCKGIIEEVRKDFIKISENLFECTICKKHYSRKGIGFHSLYHKRNGKAWNSGKNKTDTRIAKIANKVSIKMKDLSSKGLNSFQKYAKTEKFKEQMQRLSIRQSLHNSGGRSKWYEINKQKVQGTWERDLALLMNKLNINWKKLNLHKNSFLYVFGGKEKHYTPDFYLNDEDLFIEVKGFWWGNDKEKMKIVFDQHESLKEKLIVVEKKLFFSLLEIQTKEEFLCSLKNNIGSVAQA